MSQTQTMTADQATFLLHDLYLGTLKRESATTKKILEAVPAGKGEYRPDPASRTAIELTRHIAAADNRFVETVINGVFDTNPAMIPENVKTPAEMHHTIHHRGQLASYLRCMGAKVPAIYGESYDSAEAKKAAQA